MFNMSIIDIKNLATNSRTFSKGDDYYRSGMVKKLNYSSEDNEITARVSGSELYDVSIALDDDGYVDDFYCDCLAFAQYPGACKHIVAVLLEANDVYGGKPVRNPAPPAAPKKQTNASALASLQTALSSLNRGTAPAPVRQAEDPRLKYTREMLKAYTGYGQEKQQGETVNLRVSLVLSPTSYYPPQLELEIGNSRLYIVKDIRQLTEAIVGKLDLYYGKSFTYTPSLHRFKPQDQPIIDMLTEAYMDEVNTRYGYYPSVFEKRAFNLNYSRFMRFLGFAGQLSDAKWKLTSYALPTPLKVLHEALPVSFELTKKGQSVEIHAKAENPIIEITKARDVFLIGDTFYVPPREQVSALLPLFDSFNKAGGKTLPLNNDLVPAFVSEVLPKIQKACTVKISNQIKEQMHREPLIPAAWLDKHGKGISAKIAFKYGNIELNVSGGLAGTAEAKLNSENGLKDKILVRDKPGEERFLGFFTDAGFSFQGEAMILQNEEKIYDFLQEKLPELSGMGEIYYSEAFLSLKVSRPLRIGGAIRFNEDSDLLEVSFDLEGIDEADLTGFVSALKEKKRYIRLKNGAFLPMDRKENLTAAKLIEQLGISGGKDVRNMSLPKYRAMYLDNAIKEYGKEHFEVDSPFKKLVRNITEPQELEFQIPDELRDILRDYQKTGFKWLKSLSYYGLGGILADDMGLGKTLQVISFVMSDYPLAKKPSLVIAPTSLVYNWQEEIRKFVPSLKAVVMDGPPEERHKKLEDLSGIAFVITSYPLIRRDIDKMRKIQFAYCFLDEAQNIKNPATINARSVKQVKASRYFALTGTPIENSLTELWSIFDFIMPGYLYSHSTFQSRFETPIIKKDDKDALEDLGRHIRPFVLRRMKKDVLTELPEKIETKSVCDMTDAQKKVYLAYLAKARKEFEDEIAASGFERSQIKILALLTRLRQICCHPSLFLENYKGGCGKLEMLEELIQSSVSGGHRILLFSQFTSMLGIIRDRLKSEGEIRQFYIDGQTPPEERIRQVNEFNNGGAEVFLISLKAGGTGLNLTGADTVIHYDPWWNPAVEDQATDRAYRIGQTNAVQVFKLVTRGTIEEKIFELQQKKRELVDSVIKPGESFLGKMSLEDVRSLFE